MSKNEKLAALLKAKMEGKTDAVNAVEQVKPEGIIDGKGFSPISSTPVSQPEPVIDRGTQGDTSKTNTNNDPTQYLQDNGAFDQLDPEAQALVISYLQGIDSKDFTELEGLLNEVDDKVDRDETVLIGKRKPFEYMQAVENRFGEFKKVKLRARGKSCQTALDVSQIAVRKMNIKILAIHVGTEYIEKEEAAPAVLRLDKKVTKEQLARILKRKLQSNSIPITTLEIELGN